MKKRTITVQALGVTMGSGAVGVGSVLVYRGLHHQTPASHSDFGSILVGGVLAAGGLIMLSLLIWYRKD